MADVPDNLHCNFEGCDICQDLMQVEEELCALSQKRLALKQKRRALKSSKNSTHDLLRKIPVEIISHIFFFVDKDDHCPAPRPKEGLAVLSEVYFCAPVILSSVCRKWREIALASPNLWTNIHINMHKEPDSFTTEWLKRSGALPLWVTLYSNERRKDKTMARCPGDQICDSVCESLRPHLCRLEYLDVQYYTCASGNYCLHALFRDLTIEEMPRSDSFHLHIGPDYSTRHLTLKTPLRPRRLCSSGSRLNMTMFEWKNLVHLEVSHLRITDFLDIIREAPKLQHCVSLYMNGISGIAVRPVENRALKYLKLSFSELQTGSAAVQNVSLPSLQHLEYVANSYWRGEYEELQNFIVGTGLDASESLQTFTIRERRRHLDHGLFNVTAVTHLAVDSTILEPLLEKMTQDVSVFPVLQELHFEFSTTSRDLQPLSCLYYARTAVTLAKFMEEHNRHAQSVATSNDTDLNLDLTRHQYRSSHKIISFLMMADCQQYHIQMTNQTFLLLQGEQEITPLKIEIYTTWTGQDKVDILQDPRYLKDIGFGFVILKSAPS